MKNRVYIAIDLKSFYASVECVERGLDPLDTNLVVADTSRTEKTICLAVSPALKAYGIPGRARLFEAIQKVKEVNRAREYKAPNHCFKGKSYFASELKKNPSLELDFIAATPQMAKYMEISNKIYQIYLRYIDKEDIHVYSVDEVFIDATAYLHPMHLTPHELTMKLIKEVLAETGITATAGIGTNMYLAKVAMDIVAKRIPADKDGVRIAELDEMSYREELWSHTPLTDFWRVGRGYAKKLNNYRMYTMGDVARCSVNNEELLYTLFGVNAELLIDHAWGWEPCRIKDIKEYKPQNNSLSVGQVLSQPYSFEKGKLIVSEMADMLALDLVNKGLVTNQLVLTVGYDIENLKDKTLMENYSGDIGLDYYGRVNLKAAHGSINLDGFTSSSKKFLEAIQTLYDKIIDKNMTVRRMYVVASHVILEGDVVEDTSPKQMDLFTDYNALEKKKEDDEKEENKQRRLQKAVIDIKNKFGKNSVLKGMNFEEGATARERNKQVGGHKA